MSEILITRHVYSDALRLLRSVGEVDYHDSRSGLDDTALRMRVRGKKALVCQLTDRVGAELLGHTTDLRVIANIAAGVDNIDLQAATAARVLVTHTPDVLTETTADFTFALLLSVARRVIDGDRLVRSGEWGQWEIDLLCGVDVHRRTLGIVGMGRIGRAVARRARGFDMRVLYHSPRRLGETDERALHLEYVTLETLLKESDFVSLHTPLNARTHHLMGSEEFRRMKRSAILVNTARGAVVDESALCDALEGGAIAGAGLDVYEREPEVEAKLLGLGNAVLTPHIASASVETRRRMCRIAAENTVAALSGERPPNLVNPEVLELP